MLKNYTLHEINGDYLLFGQDGYPVEAFNNFILKVKRDDKAATTVKNYANWVALFFDYMCECGVFNHDNPPSFAHVNETVAEYPRFLITNYGNRQDSFYKSISISLERSRIDKSSASSHLAAVNKFLEFTDQVAKDNAQVFEILTGEAPPTRYTELLGAINTMRNVSDNERIRIRQNSVLGALIKKVSKPWKTSKKAMRLKNNRKNDDYDDFPLNQIIPLIDHAISYRDKALYALLAGSGLRQSEALALTWDNIDFESMRVRVPDENGYRDLALLDSRFKEHKMSRSKGRTTSNVMMFEPFRTMFFELLEKYRTEEWVMTDKHNYVFQYSGNQGDASLTGLPLLNASNQALNDSFRGAQKRSGMTELYTLHSLRHFYGVFLLNYMPTPNGHGLRLDQVQVCMGHELSTTTQKYARVKQDVLDAILEYSDCMLLSGMEAFSSLPDVIAQTYDKLANQIRSKEVAHD